MITLNIYKVDESGNYHLCNSFTQSNELSKDFNLFDILISNLIKEYALNEGTALHKEITIYKCDNSYEITFFYNFGFKYVWRGIKQ